MMNVNARSALYGMQVAYPYFKQREVRAFGLSYHVMSPVMKCGISMSFLYLHMTSSDSDATLCVSS